MRLVSPAPRFFAAGLLLWGCAVYDDGLTANDGLTNGGDSGNGNGVSGASTTGGKPMSMAGSSSTVGTKADAGEGANGGTGNASTAGTNSSDGGEDPIGGSATGGTGGGGAGGMNGGAGAGGKGGSGGSAAGTGGNGGSAGSAPVVKCADHPLTPKATKWVATASSSSVGDGTEASGLYNPPFHMTDANFMERWSTGKRQDGTEWIQIDFGDTVNLTQVTLNVNNDAGDYPRHYDVRFTAAADPTFKGKVLVTDDGMPGNTVILFKGIVTGRYLTVRQTLDVTDGPWWTIAEVLASCVDP